MKILVLSLFISLLTFFGSSQNILNLEFDTTNVMTIDYPMEGIIVLPTSQLTTFYLVDQNKIVLECEEKTLVASFDSEKLSSGYYYLILETSSSKTIYKLIK